MSHVDNQPSPVSDSDLILNVDMDKLFNVIEAEKVVFTVFWEHAC